ncbi:TetR/AcrR family transcriptional regulator C-terminal domain-containing protein [Saccharopolyspora sp. NPDC050389]|uniref:TetR/AcrR family transcriptional regulator C-terminal domain-containing protein n=1 Tax=Saccharopolyspora sp. NPDC050389 TaxID=3155516 RepID=UPI0033EFECC0
MDGKDDILELVTEIMVADIPASDLRPQDWRGGLLHWARGYREAFAKHPNAVAIIARRAVTISDSRQAYDDVIEMLTAVGWTHAAALRVAFGIDYVVLGSILAPFSPGFDQPLGDEYPALRTAVRTVDAAEVDADAFQDAITAYVAGLPDPA